MIRILLFICFLLFSIPTQAEVNQKWFSDLSENWKNIVRGSDESKGFFLEDGEQIQLEESPSQESLDRLSEAVEFKARNSSIYSLKPLEEFIQLRIIDCSENPIRKIKPLQKMNALEILDISGTKISNLAPIRDLDLQELYCRDIIFLSTIQDLDQMKNLRVLICANNSLEHLDAVEEMARLEILDASENYIEEIEAVRSLYRLKELILFDNPIFEIYYLQDLKELERIHLDATGINELRSFDGLENIEFLSVIETPYLTIEEIERFAALKTKCEILVR